MKKCNPILTSTFILLATTWIFSGCKGESGCPDKTETTRYIADYDLEKVAYKGNDTLRFTTNNSDTLVYIGTGKHTFFEQGYERADPNPDCGSVYNTINYEAYEMSFTGKNDIMKIVHTICPCSKPGFTLNLLDRTYSYDVSVVSAKNLTFIPYHDSLQFNNTTYYEVSVFYLNNDSIYMNQYHGILKVKSNINDFCIQRLD